MPSNEEWETDIGSGMAEYQVLPPLVMRLATSVFKSAFVPMPATGYTSPFQQIANRPALVSGKTHP